MTPRKKTGIGFFISGGLFIGGGVIFYFLPATPVWLPMVFSIVGYIASTLGFKIVFPDVD